MNRSENRRAMDRTLLALIIAIGLFARLYRFGNLPGGINQDEALAGFEAYSLLKTGRDSCGLAFPVYLVAWGSGMNVLETYLMIPFIALFGFHAWVIRLPQLIVGCLSIPAVYSLVRRLSDRTVALFSALLLAISPWHVMLCRWGLESNLLPGFLLFGLLFFVMGLEKPRFLLLSALMYGLALYCYAIFWPVMPPMLLAQFLLCAKMGRLKRSRYWLAAGVLLFCMALPLLLFCGVNYLGMDEIRLPFLSIPKLTAMRTGEIGSRSIASRIFRLAKVILRQSDGSIWNGIRQYGVFYLCTMPFFFLGLFAILFRSVRALRSGVNPPMLAILGFQMGFGLLIGLAVPSNINRVNCLFIPMIVVAAYGIVALCRRLNLRLIALPIVAYLCLFGMFERTYFTEYPAMSAEAFEVGLGEAVERAAELGEGRVIYAAKDVTVPRLLYYGRVDPAEYQASVAYKDGAARCISSVVGFENFRMDGDCNHPDPNGVYLLGGGDTSDEEEALREAGFQIERYETCRVAWKEEK